MLRAQLPLETPTDSDAAAGPVATDGAGRFGGVGVAADAIAAAGRLSGVDMCRAGTGRCGQGGHTARAETTMYSKWAAARMRYRGMVNRNHSDDMENGDGMSSTAMSM